MTSRLARRRKRSRFVVIGAALTVVGAALVSPLGAAGAAVAAVKAPPGAGTPVAASGIGTAAALDNPKCQHDNPNYGVYGRFSGTTVGGGPICVKPWKDGDDNGGATSPGVTKDAVTVVAVVPNETQLTGTSAAAGTAPVRRVDQSPGDVRRRDPRLPAPADEVLRDVGPRHRDEVRDVVRERRGGTARRRRHDQGGEAVRGDQPGHAADSTCSTPRSPRRRSSCTATRPPRRRRWHRLRTGGA